MMIFTKKWLPVLLGILGVAAYITGWKDVTAVCLGGGLLFSIISARPEDQPKIVEDNDYSEVEEEREVPPTENFDPRFPSLYEDPMSP